MKIFEKRFDFSMFSVVLTPTTIIYITKDDSGQEMWTPIIANFENSIDPEEDGGKIEIRYTDSWGCEMKFIHYQPTSLESLFIFIARAYLIKGVCDLRRDTGLKDSEGATIRDGDDLLWEYQSYGERIRCDDGIRRFQGCFPASLIRKRFKVQKVKFEVSEKKSGYFLDVPSGMGTIGLQDKIKCTVIKYETAAPSPIKIN